MLQDLALLVGRADSELRARVDACSLSTGLIRRTVSFEPALDLSVRTGEFSELVDDKTVLADAFGFVGKYGAFLVESTGLDCAGVDTLPCLGVAGSSYGAARVGCTSRRLNDARFRIRTSTGRTTPHMRLTNVTIRAFAAR
jgi:hypothetical protein